MKLGDEVEILKDTDLDTYILKKGQMGIIVDIDEGSQYPYYVKLNLSDDTRVFRECELKEIVN